jgi:hypothetical protein
MEAEKQLKQNIEDLSEYEMKRWKLLKKISNIVDDMEINQINQLPELYRIEIKRALEEVGHLQLATKVRN